MKKQHFYFMGIAGTAMGNLALMLRRQGHRISGADLGVYPPMSDALREGGIEWWDGWDAERLASLKPDQVVVGNVVGRGHPEMEWLLETRALPFTSMPAMIGEALIGRRPALVVAGTHGKTTTTSLLAYLLKRSGLEPGWLIGGVPRDLPGGASPGLPESPFVIEGDEYDSAFFDKRSKFIHYRPRILVLNNLEFDHGDIFRDLEDIKRSFRHLIRLVPQGGAILYNGDDANLTELLPVPWCRCFSVGLGEQCDLRIEGFAEAADGSRFSLSWRGTRWAEIRWGLGGLYNARNAAQALLAASLHQTAPGEAPRPPECASLEDFRGVKRRQEVLLDTSATLVIEDFGHHPTAVGDTLQSLRSRYPVHRLVACFEARSNTACTRVFESRFVEALALADAVYLAPLYRPERYAEDERLQVGQMVQGLSGRGVAAQAPESMEAMVGVILEDARADPADRPCCLVFFSNGAFGGVIPRVVAGLGVSAAG